MNEDTIEIQTIDYGFFILSNYFSVQKEQVKITIEEFNPKLARAYFKNKFQLKIEFKKGFNKHRLFILDNICDFELIVQELKSHFNIEDTRETK
jgi:hypothetical protein